MQWYDQVLAVVARAHFFVPPTLLFLIWLERRELFYRAVVALVGVSLVGALVFLVFPAAPPWRASEVGLLPDLVKIGTAQAAASPVDATRSFISNMELPNPYAAVPSLHTAYSLLTFVFAFSWRRRIGWAFLAYPLVMWFTIVYFADHYVADIIVGAAMALTRGGPPAASSAPAVASRGWPGPSRRRSHRPAPSEVRSLDASHGAPDQPALGRACTRRPAAWRCLRAEARRGRVPALRRRRLPRPAG